MRSYAASTGLMWPSTTIDRSPAHGSSGWHPRPPSRPGQSGDQHFDRRDAPARANAAHEPAPVAPTLAGARRPARSRRGDRRVRQAHGLEDDRGARRDRSETTCWRRSSATRRPRGTRLVRTGSLKRPTLPPSVSNPATRSQVRRSRGLWT